MRYVHWKSRWIFWREWLQTNSLWMKPKTFQHHSYYSCKLIIIKIKIIIKNFEFFAPVVTDSFTEFFVTTCLLSSFMTFMSFLADLTSVVVLTVSIVHLIFSSHNLLFKFLGTVPRVRTTIAFTVNFVLHNFFSFKADEFIEHENISDNN